jgi:hypothetical protein
MAPVQAVAAVVGNPSQIRNSGPTKQCSVAMQPWVWLV